MLTWVVDHCAPAAQLPLLGSPGHTVEELLRD